MTKSLLFYSILKYSSIKNKFETSYKFFDKPNGSPRFLVPSSMVFNIIFSVVTGVVGGT